MKESFSWITPKQAGELAGYTARHIQNLIVQGKLSATKEDGKYYIDKSEFFRMFPKAHNEERKRNSSSDFAERERIVAHNNSLQDMSSKKDKEIEFLRNQIEFISQEKVKMLDALVIHTKILEHKADFEKKGKVAGPKRSWREFFKFGVKCK